MRWVDGLLGGLGAFDTLVVGNGLGIDAGEVGEGVVGIHAVFLYEVSNDIALEAFDALQTGLCESQEVPLAELDIFRRIVPNGVDKILTLDRQELDANTIHNGLGLARRNVGAVRHSGAVADRLDEPAEAM